MHTAGVHAKSATCVERLACMLYPTCDAGIPSLFTQILARARDLYVILTKPQDQQLNHNFVCHHTAGGPPTWLGDDCGDVDDWAPGWEKYNANKLRNVPTAARARAKTPPAPVQTDDPVEPSPAASTNHKRAVSFDARKSTPIDAKRNWSHNRAPITCAWSELTPVMPFFSDPDHELPFVTRSKLASETNGICRSKHFVPIRRK